MQIAAVRQKTARRRTDGPTSAEVEQICQLVVCQSLSVPPSLMTSLNGWSESSWKPAKFPSERVFPASQTWMQTYANYSKHRVETESQAGGALVFPVEAAVGA